MAGLFCGSAVSPRTRAFPSPIPPGSLDQLQPAPHGSAVSAVPGAPQPRRVSAEEPTSSSPRLSKSKKASPRSPSVELPYVSFPEWSTCCAKLTAGDGNGIAMASEVGTRRAGTPRRAVLVLAEEWGALTVHPPAILSWCSSRAWGGQRRPSGWGSL